MKAVKIILFIIWLIITMNLGVFLGNILYKITAHSVILPYIERFFKAIIFV